MAETIGQPGGEMVEHGRAGPATLTALVMAAAGLAIAAWVAASAWCQAPELAEAAAARVLDAFDGRATAVLQETERNAMAVAADFLAGREPALAMPMPFGLVDGQGRVVKSSDDRIGAVLADAVRDHPTDFRPPTGPEPPGLVLLRTRAGLVSAADDPLSLLAWRIGGGSGGFAVVVAVVDGAGLARLMAGPEVRDGVRVALVTLSGDLVVPTRERGGLVVAPLLKRLGADALSTDAFGGTRGEVEADGAVWRLAFHRLGRYPLAAVAAIREEDVVGPWRLLAAAAVLALSGLSGVVVVLACAHRRAMAQQRQERERQTDVRTVEDRRIAERLLAAERLTHLGHWEHDLIGARDYWSAETYQILGLRRRHDADGFPALVSAIHPDDSDSERTARILALAGVTPYNVQVRIQRPDGALRHVQLQAEILRAEGGEPVKLIGTILDITDRVAIEQRLRDSEERYRTIFEAAHDALILVDRATDTVIDANGAANRLYGYERERLLGLAWATLVVDEHTHLCRDARRLQVEVSAAEARISGLAVGVMAVRDVTARKQAEVEVRLLTRAIEQSPLSVIITTQSGDIVYVNPHFVTATGYTAQEVMGRNPRLFKSGYTTASEYTRLWQTISAGKIWQGEFHNRMKNGDMHWESASVAPVRDERGAITHFVAVKEDITRRKRAEIELLAAKERAEAASISKSQFLGTISHELRTPLNVILGFSQLLATAPDTLRYSPKFVEYAWLIHTHGTHLLALINDLLDLAKIEAGTFALHEAFVDLEDVASAAIDSIRARAEAGQLMLTANLSPTLPLLLGDDRAMRQIMINLLSNAVKFTREDGWVTVTAGLDANGLMAFSVGDSGIGMAEADIARALEPFGQIDNTLSRRHDGAGLGLPLCRSLVEMHGGHLEIASTVGVGTVVTVRFPRDRIVVPGHCRGKGGRGRP